MLLRSLPCVELRFYTAEVLVHTNERLRGNHATTVMYTFKVFIGAVETDAASVPMCADLQTIECERSPVIGSLICIQSHPNQARTDIDNISILEFASQAAQYAIELE